MKAVGFYLTETKEEYNRVLNDLEKKGYKWATGVSLEKFRLWLYEEETCLIIYSNNYVTETSLEYIKRCFSQDIFDNKIMRKSQRLYYIKFMEDDEESYLNKHRESCHVSLGLSLEDDIFQTKFAEHEINELGLKYWSFAIEVK